MDTNMLIPECSSRPSRPFVRIIEQPSKYLKFRYVCESRPALIHGVSSTSEHKVPFTVEVVGYQGRIIVVVSCVTQNPPYKPHPHILAGPNCKDGYCTLRTEVTPENSKISFPKLAVQCVRKKEVAESLRIRQQKNIDPFLTGFEHSNDVKSIDLNVVRLCVQVFHRGEGKDLEALNPVVSTPISNKKRLPDPLIYRLSQCNCCVNGNVNGKPDDEIFLLCTKISKEDIKVRFFEVQDDVVVWEDYGRFEANGVYNNSAICFKPPQYYDQDITEPVKVYLQLVRMSDEAVSPPYAFEYLPLDTEPGALAKKRKLCDGNPLFHQLGQRNEDHTAKTFIDLDKFLPGPSSSLQLSAPSTSRDTSNDYIFKETNTYSDGSYNFFANNHSFLNDLDAIAGSTTRNETISNLTNFLNNIDSTAGRSRQSDNSGFNIECANVVQDMLPNCQDNELPVIHLSSGDLEMRSVERLSESFQESLVI